MLLLKAGDFADPVGHHAHQSLSQFRHFLNQLRKRRRRKTQRAAIHQGSPAYGKSLHSRKWQRSCNLARLQVEDEGFTAAFAPALEFSLQNHEHGIGGSALLGIDITRFENQFLRLADKPVELIVWQIGERGNTS